MKRTWIGVFGAVLLCLGLVDAVPYSKYGRTCQDIGCLSDEQCIIVEDPCSLPRDNNCGRYPKCEKRSGSGTQGSSLNGQRTDGIHNQDHGSSHTNYNPYSNANAPPSSEPHDTRFNQRPSNTDLGYPSYPSNSGSVSRGYPPYPATSGGQHPSQGTNLGYPPYPTENRMPQPGIYQSGYPNNGYPHQQQQPGLYNQYPTYYNNHNYYAPPRRPYGGYRHPKVTPKPVVRTPPPPPQRTSSLGYPWNYGRYPSSSSNSIGTQGNRDFWNRVSDGGNRNGGGSGHRGQNSSTYTSDKGYHKTHTSTDNKGNRVWTFSRAS